MSTFSGFIPELPGIAIDRFEEPHRSGACTFFLSHCHADHMRGLDGNVSLPGTLYLSPISGVFVKHRFPQYANVVHPFYVGEQLALKIKPPTGEDAYELYVRSLSAEHCPGSVMFYFETNTVRVLYTGDFRLSSQKNFEAQSAGLHPQIVYLDSTFLDLDYSFFPTREASTARIVSLCTEWLAADKRNVISLWLPAMYGSEELFLKLYDRLKEKIHISEKQRGPYMHFSSLSAVLTHDSSVRIHACGGTARPSRKLPCQTVSNEGSEGFIRTIRPSALRWRGLQPSDQFWKDSKGLFYICYSSHASCDELVQLLRYLRLDVEQIRFNVIADDADESEKERIVESILDDKSAAKSISIVKKRTITHDDVSLNLNKIQYKSNHCHDHHDTKAAESSDSEGNGYDVPYSKLPKRMG